MPRTKQSSVDGDSIVFTGDGVFDFSIFNEVHDSNFTNAVQLYQEDNSEELKFNTNLTGHIYSGNVIKLETTDETYYYIVSEQQPWIFELSDRSSAMSYLRSQKPNKNSINSYLKQLDDTDVKKLLSKRLKPYYKQSQYSTPCHYTDGQTYTIPITDSEVAVEDIKEGHSGNSISKISHNGIQRSGHKFVRSATHFDVDAISADDILKLTTDEYYIVKDIDTTTSQVTLQSISSYEISKYYDDKTLSPELIREYCADIILEVTEAEELFYKYFSP
jgi:hypothetical protein